MSASMPLASGLGIVAGGSVDQSTLINSALSNPAYAGIVFDLYDPGGVYISNDVNGQGKVLRFEPGCYLTAPNPPGTLPIVGNFELDCGFRQQCIDIDTTSMSPTYKPLIDFRPGSTTLGKISPWVFGASEAIADSAPAIQAAIYLICTETTGIQTLFIPSGTYLCGSSLICYNWNGEGYENFQISIEGEANFWEADGYGTTLTFTATEGFGIGFQHTKGSSVKNLKLIGQASYPGPNPNNPPEVYDWYNYSLADFPSGGCRDSRYSPNAGIVVDPFSPTALDGGYPEFNGSGGGPTFYRGSLEGSTGVTLEDVFITNWTIGFITSPNGETENAELIRAEKIQFMNMKVCIVGCQAQEKMNVFRHVGCWGNCHTFFLSGSNAICEYGVAQAGNWYIEDVNLAGYNNQFAISNQEGWFPTFFKGIYAESLGSLGPIGGYQTCTIESSSFDFAYYDSTGACSYQVHIPNVGGASFIGCSFRIYGTAKPIAMTVNGGTFGGYFDNCSFEVPPITNLQLHRGNPVFVNCKVGDGGINMGAGSPLWCSNVDYSNTFAYGNGKISPNGLPTFTFNSFSPAQPMPINRLTYYYTVSKSLVGSTYQAVISCYDDELNRVAVGDVIVGGTDTDLTLLAPIGVVTAVGDGTFTIDYIPAWVINGGNYYLYVWLPMYNVAFTGNTSYGSNQITNVNLLAGDLNRFIFWGGLMQTTSVQVSDYFHSNLIRLLAYDPVSAIVTFDKTAVAYSGINMFNNTDPACDHLFAGITPGAGAGSSGTAVFTRTDDRTSMQINVTTGTGSAVSDIVATIGFGLPFPGGYVPSPRFSPANAAAAALTGASQVFMDSGSSSGFTITSGSTALADSTTYLWNVEIG